MKDFGEIIFFLVWGAIAAIGLWELHPQTECPINSSRKVCLKNGDILYADSIRFLPETQEIKVYHKTTYPIADIYPVSAIKENNLTNKEAQKIIDAASQNIHISKR